MSVREPTADWDSMLWVKYIGGWRVVDDDGVFEVPPDLGQIFHVVALMVVAALSKQSVVDHFVNVQLIQ